MKIKRFECCYTCIYQISFTNICEEDNTIPLGDETTKVIINASGNREDLSKEIYNKKEICVTDSLNKGKSLAKNGIPVAFLIEKSYNNYHLIFFIYGVKSKVIIDNNISDCPAC